jgi:hypothetical protein
MSGRCSNTAIAQYMSGRCSNTAIAQFMSGRCSHLAAEADMTALSDDTTVISDDTAVISDDTAVISDDTTVISDDTTVISDDTTIISDDTTVIASSYEYSNTPLKLELTVSSSYQCSTVAGDPCDSVSLYLHCRWSLYFQDTTVIRDGGVSLATRVRRIAAKAQLPPLPCPRLAHAVS